MSSEPTFSSLVRFGRQLRAAGLGVSLAQLEACARAFQWLDPLARNHVYCAARATLLTRREDLALFDRIFAAFWLGQQEPQAGTQAPIAPRHPRQERPALATLLAQRAQLADPEVEVRDRSHTASDDEQLRRRDFAALSAEELEAVRRQLAQERWQFATRVTRRTRPRRNGPELDLRRLAARSARTGGVLLTLPRRARTIQRRPLVVLADVSGSMELYTRVLLQFFHALRHGKARQQVAQVESFVFATRLTRITHELSLKHVDRALEQVSAQVHDFASGTRIGQSLHEFNAVWAGRVLARGAVVIVVSDGWERAGAEVLQKEVRVLRERCHRLIWLNPRLGQPSYEPRVAGMAAALPFVDDFLACHNLQSLRALSDHLARLPRRRGRARAYAALTPAGITPKAITLEASVA
ncbi:MAG: hypothetical protein RL685_1848 [Pseudomonadota bacterium]|jgi:uncharacterized protein with von Willebrand factor type A (vWA) domain